MGYRYLWTISAPWLDRLWILSQHTPEPTVVAGQDWQVTAELSATPFHHGIKLFFYNWLSQRLSSLSGVDSPQLNLS